MTGETQKYTSLKILGIVAGVIVLALVVFLIILFVSKPQGPVTQVEEITKRVLTDDPGAVLVEQTENSLKFKLSDGQYRLVSSVGQLSAPGGEAIDANLNTDTGSEWLAETGPGLDYALKIRADGSRRFIPRKNYPDEYMDLGSPEYYDGANWLVLSLDEAKVDGERISWDGDSYTLEYTVAPAGFKENLILKNSSANYVLRWPVILGKLTQDGQDIYSGTDSALVATLVAPFWTDAKGQRGEVSWEIQPGYIQFMPKITGDVQYPVTVDPSFNVPVTLGTNDGYVYPEASSFDNDETSSAVGYVGASNTRNVWLRFPNITAPQGSEISSAVITWKGLGGDVGSTLSSIFHGANANDYSAPASFSDWNTAHGSLTSAAIDYDFTIAASGTTMYSPNIASIVQEVVERTGWASGNNIGIFWDNDSSSKLVYVATIETGSGAPSIDITYSLPVGAVELDVAVTASADDGYWGTTVDFNSGEGQLFIGNANTSSYHSFMRFLNVAVPKDSNILSAHLTLKAAYSDAGDTVSARIYANDTDSATAPTSHAAADLLALTDAYTSWSKIPGWTASGTYISPDFSSAVEEVIARSGWASGNNLQILLMDNASTANMYRRPASLDNTSYTEPVLHIVYIPSITVDVVESGATDTYTVVLASEPTHDVTINISTADGQTTVDDNSLVFNSTNWDTPKTVTVTAVHDNSVVETNPHTGTITHTAVSEDPKYDGIVIGDVTANITDDLSDYYNYLGVPVGSGKMYKRIEDTFTALASSAPGTYGPSFSPDAAYYAVGISSSPYIRIYKRSGDVFTQLTNPTTLPTGSVFETTFSSDGAYLALALGSSPYIYIYKRNGDTFAKLANPDVIPSATQGATVAWSPDSVYLVLGHNGSGYATVYKRSNDTFTKLSDLSPGSTVFGAEFSSDGTYLALALGSSPYIRIYKHSGDTFDLLANPATLPASLATEPSFSPNGNYLAVSHYNSPCITIYKRSGDTFAKLANPTVLPTTSCHAADFSSDGTYLSVAHDASPYLTIYRRSGDTFTKLSNPSELPGTYAQGVEFSPSLLIPLSGITVAESEGSTGVTEGSFTDTYTVVLDGPPSDNVVINIVDDAQVNVDKASLTFTTYNWMTPQTVTVSAEDDAQVENTPHFGSISMSVDSEDENYDEMEIDNINVSITDNDIYSSGFLESTTFDTGLNDGFIINSVMWNGTEVPSTTVSFQLAVSNSESGPFTFVGPNCSEVLEYVPDHQGIPVFVRGSCDELHPYTAEYRYLRYKIFIDNGTQEVGPVVDDVIVNWSP